MSFRLNRMVMTWLHWILLQMGKCSPSVRQPTTVVGVNHCQTTICSISLSTPMKLTLTRLIVELKKNLTMTLNPNVAVLGIIAYGTLISTQSISTSRGYCDRTAIVTCLILLAVISQDETTQKSVPSTVHACSPC